MDKRVAFRRALAWLLVKMLVATACALGQSPDDQSSQPAPMPEGPHQHMHHGAMPPGSLIDEIVQHSLSGTSIEPSSTPADMLMTTKGTWGLMLHGVAFLNAIQQNGPRGADKVFSTNWIMGMAQRSLGPGSLTLRAMLSLEPATVSERRYPELFQQGETAFGRPLVDGQHPHDFFMELATLYDLKLGEHGLLSFYLAPVGDPAMGPTAYPHRASASEDPTAPLGHHLQDSTHVAWEVVTVGATYKQVRLEASGFHGREPNEGRWNIDTGEIDSWSARLTANPAANWSAQYSIASLTSPEALHPQEDIQRMTASLSYNRPLQNGNWATTLVWGHNRIRGRGQVANGYLAESTLRFSKHNFVWGRVENVDRSSELLLDGNPEPPAFEETFLARVQAYTAGYDREFMLLPRLATALGGEVTFYGKPALLTPLYGSHPLGIVAFLRVRAAGQRH